MKNLRVLIFILCICAANGVTAATINKALLSGPTPLHGGGSIPIGELIGKKPMYLKFWASWCGTCREQMPHLEEAYQKYGDKMEVISVNIWINESEEAIEETQREFGLTVPVAIDEQGILAKIFNFVATPYHVLIDGDGNVVHTGHAADAELDQRLELLAARANYDLPPVALQATEAGQIDIAGEGVTALFFTSTWCDWYLQDSRPAMSQACVQAQQTMNQVSIMLPDLRLFGVASRLWTSDKELTEYIEKFDITHAFMIDKTNDTFLALNVNTVPTLVLLKDGQEVSRTSEIKSAQQIVDAIRSLSE